MAFERSAFGDDFRWGVASAAFQVEGAWDVDGKRPSIWDQASIRGRVRGGRVGLDGIDAYHHLDEDLDLIAALGGVTSNRFSVSWTRVFGDGRGPWNERGGAYYDRLIDGCLARGIEPWLTVHHWDLPLALHRHGGWAGRGIVEDFATFAQELGRRYGDRVKHWMVVNEPMSIMWQALAGIHDRYGIHLHTALRTIHHLNLASAEAGRRLRAVLDHDATIGTTNVMTVCAPYDATGRLRRAQRTLEALNIDAFLDPPAGLGYPTEASFLLRPIRRYLRDGDIEAMAFDYDFMGLQYYGPWPMRPVPLLGGVPRSSMPGAEVDIRSATKVPVDPDGLVEVLRRYRDHPACRRIVITECGFSMHDRLVDGRVHDEARSWYLRTHLDAVLRAKADGIPIDGFFQWSYADNIEWHAGRRPRFGLVYIDYDDDFRRVPKDSYYWFQRFLHGAPSGPS